MPSNKTYGNCLLGLHCSQKDPAQSRANARFQRVAGHQQQKSSTGYPQSLVDCLGIVGKRLVRLAGRRQRLVGEAGFYRLGDGMPEHAF
jgi:hypothetical protein